MNNLSFPFDSYRARVESALNQVLPAVDNECTRLNEAMRYASLNGGKRIRAMLVYGAGHVVNADPVDLDPCACAVELIHAYSLVHDDLPAMDNDTLRRGKPTCHLAFDEATAILVGDGLQSLAFEALAGHQSTRVSDNQKLRIIQVLASAAGPGGMVGGQARDMAAQGRELSLGQLKQLHQGKTGALIKASVLLGALSGDPVSADELEAFEVYANRIGLAFQIVDDILDEEADTATLGKTSGMDRALAKATFPGTIGLQTSRDMVRECYAQALSALDILNADTHILKVIAELVVAREY